MSFNLFGFFLNLAQKDKRKKKQDKTHKAFSEDKEITSREDEKINELVKNYSQLQDRYKNLEQAQQNTLEERRGLIKETLELEEKNSKLEKQNNANKHQEELPRAYHSDQYIKEDNKKIEEITEEHSQLQERYKSLERKNRNLGDEGTRLLKEILELREKNNKLNKYLKWISVAVGRDDSKRDEAAKEMIDELLPMLRLDGTLPNDGYEYPEENEPQKIIEKGNAQIYFPSTRRLIKEVKKEIVDLTTPRHGLTADGYINFLFYYYPVKKRMHDRLSRWIREIKDGDLVLSLAFSIYIFKRIRFDQGCISRALKHDELFVNPSDEQVTPVDILGLMLENDEVAYRPDLLKKRRPNKKLSSLPSKEKRDELDGNYIFENDGFERLLVIDDVATTGTTFEVISDVALKQNSISSVSYIVFTRTVKPFVKTKQVDFDYDAFNEYHAYAKKKLL